MESQEQLIKVKTLIKELYNSTDQPRLHQILIKASQRLEADTDVSDLTAHIASAINYIRNTENLEFSSEQENWWRELRDLGHSNILYHDPKNNLLDLSDK